MERNKHISIIILNWNGKRWLVALLDSIKSQTNQDFEVICIDNNSSDDSLQILKAYPSVRVIAFQQNMGYAMAYNLVSALTSAPYLLFLNNDTIIESTFINYVLNIIKNDNAKLIAPLVVGYDGLGEQYCGLNVDIVGYPGFHHSRRSFYVEGCALIIDAQLFRTIGGFDSEYFMYAEDVDLCWRAQLVGVNITHCENATVRHFGGGVSVSQSTTHDSLQTTELKRYFGERNRLLNLLKNYSMTSLLFAIPVYFAINLATITSLVFSGQSALCMAFFRAWSWHVENLPRTLRKRRKVQASRKVSDLVIVSKMWWGSNQWRALQRHGLPRVSAPVSAATAL